MKREWIVFVFYLLLHLMFCGPGLEDSDQVSASLAIPTSPLVNPAGSKIADRFKVPPGYKRVPVAADSFADYLRHLPLKPHGTKVCLYNGKEKFPGDIHAAVIDLDIGKRNLQQCADAIMRLRGEYLFARGEYGKIHFNFTNGFRVDYSRWIEGFRVAIQGNHSHWVKETGPSNSYQDFRHYMNVIFAYAGTISLASELAGVQLQDMEIGDIFIQSGHPGHAVIIVDMATNEDGDKIFLLAQSYMPAQDIHVLVNLDRKEKSIAPWYDYSFGKKLRTPEWIFKSTDLKRFKEE